MAGLLHITPFFFNTYSQGAPQIVKTQVVVKLRHTLRHSTCVSMSFGIIEPHKILAESGYLTPTVSGISTASERGAQSEVAHKWAKWLPHPCRMGDPRMFYSDFNTVCLLCLSCCLLLV